MASNIPGTIPARYNSGTDVSVSKPYKTSAIDGGIRIPKVPPAATDPRNSDSLYPFFSISGYETVPTVAAVATLEPEVAAKIALEAIFACIKPPGSQDIHFVTAAYILCETPDRRMISPNKMNIGTATNRNSE